jgi:hypothetical protein
MHFYRISFPIVAACVLRWIEFRILDSNYFKLDQGTTPVHLIIVDEVSEEEKTKRIIITIKRNVSLDSEPSFPIA